MMRFGKIFFSVHSRIESGGKCMLTEPKELFCRRPKKSVLKNQLFVVDCGETRIDRNPTLSAYLCLNSSQDVSTLVLHAPVTPVTLVSGIHELLLPLLAYTTSLLYCLLSVSYTHLALGSRKVKLRNNK